MDRAKLVKHIRTKMGVTQEVFGSLVGLSIGQISHYENNRRKCSADAALKMTRVADEHGVKSPSSRAKIKMEDFFGV